jgi:choline dehydrogenase-like flavoprotein
MPRYRFDDEDVVVIVGSGAGGGTLANELCQKGVKVVVLEAGRHHTPDDFVNDEWRSFKQLAWLDNRTTSGSFRVAKPVPNVHFDDHPNDLAMREHAWAAGEALYESVGAVKTIRTPPYPATHNLGTARMSERPEDGVVNTFGQAHDVPNLFVSDGSQFTSGAACNPTLTIVSLAIRQADYIAGAMQKKEI